MLDADFADGPGLSPGRTAGVAWLLALVAVALLRSGLLATITPPYQFADEQWHLDHARVISEGRLPVLGETTMDLAIVDHHRETAAANDLPAYGLTGEPFFSREAFQPPLAYVLPAAGYAISDDPAVALGLFRGLDVLLGAAIVLLAVMLARRAVPSRPTAAALVGLTAAGLPSLGVVSAGANNDVLVVAAALAVLAGAVTVAREGCSRRQALLLGAGVGLAGLVKANGLLLAVPVLLAVVLSPGGRYVWRGRVAGVVGAAGVVAGPWIVRNLVVYGDFLGTSAFEPFGPRPGLEYGGLGLLVGMGGPGNPVTDSLWAQVWQTIVGVLGWTSVFLPRWAYVLAAAATVTGVVIAGRRLRGAFGRAGTREWTSADLRAGAVLLSTVPVFVAGWLWFLLMVDFQPQGRYLLPAVLATVVVMGSGLRWRAVAVAGVVLAVLLGVGLVTAAQTYA